MAANSALQLAAQDSKSVKSVFPWLVAMLFLTAAGAGAGTLFGLRLITLIKATDHVENHAADVSSENSKYPSGLTVYSLPPVVSNLASSGSLWVRIDGAILYDKETVQKPEILAAQISEDTLGFLKTLTLGDISGPSGLQQLREDLNERAFIRSEGKVRELILQSLIIQ